MEQETIVKGYDADLECDAYKTFIYGGTVNIDYPDEARNAAFLDAQMAGVRNAIADKPFGKLAQPRKMAPWKKK